jgi:hypothetical protein
VYATADVKTVVAQGGQLRCARVAGKIVVMTIHQRRSMFLLFVAALISNGCAITNKMSGVSEAREIQKVGEAARGTVVQVWDTGITVNNDPVIGLRLTVQRPGREPYEAVINKSRVSRVDIPRFQPGSQVPVRVDPQDPARIALDVYKY